jgi:hypothetical protein
MKRAITILAGLLALDTAHALNTNSVRLGVDVRTAMLFTDIMDDQPVSIAPNQNGYFPLTPMGIDLRAGIDALLVVSNLIVFSTDVTFMNGTNVFADEDLVAFNANTAALEMYFDGSTAGVPPGADIDAAALASDGTPLLSFDTPVTLPGIGGIGPSDVVKYSGGFIMKYPAATLGIPAGRNLDALHFANNNSHLYFSLDTTATIGTNTLPDQDVWDYDGATTAAIPGFPIPGASDLNALDDITDTDNDWLSDFEEISGIDEFATTFPGLPSQLRPFTNSSPDVADTDGDLFTDGEEAAAGSDPTDPSNFLHITALQNIPGAQVVTWSSGIFKFYELQGASELSSFTNIVASSILSFGTSKTYTNTGASQNFYRVRLKP